MVDARVIGKVPKGIPDTVRCHSCKAWMLRSKLPLHVKENHPEIPAKREAYLRELYKVPDGMTLTAFFDEGEQSGREKMVAASKAKEPKEPKVVKQAGPCLDMCGQMANPGRNFLPGHDAKLKSSLIRISEGGEGEVHDLVRPLLAGDLFKGRFAEMASPKWKKPPAQASKPKSSPKPAAKAKAKAAEPDVEGDKADAVARLGAMAKANAAAD